MRKISFLLAVLMLLMLTACGGEAAPAETAAPAQTTAATEPIALNMQELYDTLTAAEGMPEMLPLDSDMQMNFCGISAADCAQSAVAICANSLRTDEIWLIEAVDAAALERIRTMAENRLTAKGEESITYSPEQYAIVQEAQIITHGNYFVLLVSPDVNTLAQLFRDAAGI